MKCKKCGRTLKSKESMLVGIGPVCFKKLFPKPKKKKAVKVKTLKRTRKKNANEPFGENYDIPGQISIEEYIESIEEHP